MFFVSSISSKKRTKNTLHKDCSIKVRSKHSAVLLLCLLRNLMHQTLVTHFLTCHKAYKCQYQMFGFFFSIFLIIDKNTAEFVWRNWALLHWQFQKSIIYVNDFKLVWQLEISFSWRHVVINSKKKFMTSPYVNYWFYLINM